MSYLILNNKVPLGTTKKSLRVGVILAAIIVAKTTPTMCKQQAIMP